MCNYYTKRDIVYIINYIMGDDSQACRVFCYCH